MRRFAFRIAGERGVALLITLAVMAVVVALGLEFNRQMRHSATMASQARDRVTLGAMVSSGVHGAMAVLAKDKEGTSVDSVQEDWARPEKLAQLVGEMPFDEGLLMISITDEMGKIQVNALAQDSGNQRFNVDQQAIWSRFLSRFIPIENRDDHTSPEAIIASVKDWIDWGDDGAVTGLNGAESDYYLDNDPSYECPNRFISDISELLRIKGITRELYHGTGNTLGISEYMTPYGFERIPEKPPHFSGRVNINTAPGPVLASLLPPEYEDQVEMLVQYRIKTSGGNYVHNLTNPKWYRDVPGFGNVVISPDLITLSSDIFSITAEARLHDSEMVARTVVKRTRDKKTGKFYCKVLSYNVE